jgi:hypothetical protein
MNQLSIPQLQAFTNRKLSYHEEGYLLDDGGTLCDPYDEIRFSFGSDEDVVCIDFVVLESGLNGARII